MDFTKNSLPFLLRRRRMSGVLQRARPKALTGGTWKAAPARRSREKLFYHA